VIVKDLEKMERIVSKNYNLKWDGWNVLELKKTNLGRINPDGIRINDEWYTKKTFVPDSSGWNIPSRYQE
jgi:hypothetical protein